MVFSPLSYIGQWMRRGRADDGSVAGKVHLVESEINDRLVMHCGRQMKLVTKAGQLWAFGAFSRDGSVWCRQCGPD